MSGSERSRGPGRGPALPILGDRVSRRGFMKTLGLAAAAAGLDGCWQPPSERILPYAAQPPEVVPGNPLSYATASVLEGYATGLLVQTREGRPIKVEGNPSHPASLGATGVFEQAMLRDLYDAARTRGIGGKGGPHPWSDVLDAFRPLQPGEANGVAVLLEPTSSPLRGRLLDRLEEHLPGVRVYFHTPVGPSPAIAAYTRTAGRPLVPRYDLSRARTVVALDADFVSGMPFHLRYAHDFAARRAPGDAMSRLYVAEPVPSPVSTVADHPLRVRAGDVVFLLGELVRALGGGTPGLAPAPDRLDTERVRAWVDSAARDLRAHPGEGVVMVGETQPPAAHALAHEANRVIGAWGSTVVLQEPALQRATDVDGGLSRLTDAMGAGDVDRLIVLGGDPAHTAPADVPFADAMGKVAHTLYLGSRANATAARSEWTVPELHPFETWGDARAFDGTLTPVQPLIRPLYGSALSPDRLLLALLHEPDTSVYQALRDHWIRDMSLGPSVGAAESWEDWWGDVLSRGTVEGTAFPAVSAPDVDPAPLLSEVHAAGDGVEIAFRPDACLYDGRFAANPWLQELPDPLTKLSWANAALMSPRFAEELGVGTGDPVLVDVGGRQVEAPAFPVAGHADAAVTLTLGHGTDAVGPYRPLGVDAYPVRTTAGRWAAACSVTPTGGEGVDLPIAQTERHQNGRPVVLAATLRDFRNDPDFTSSQRGTQETWYGSDPPVEQAEHQWGMTIDLSICTGCSACMVACRAENNIPVVGPEDVRKGRIMDWIRIDAYTTGPDEEPDAHLRQPMLCQHCEDAPCEYVCPVYATVHSDDGLNEMVYNRCVGTRFCSNNCPYKVRRFNWFAYYERREPVEDLVLNPDVTVRNRGVMEKCSYCVQRIRRGEIAARREGRELGGDEVVTACQQACPTRAIVFGDIADPGSEVSRMRQSPRRYEELHELGTRPRTQYLARITNPAGGGEGAG